MVSLQALTAYLDDYLDARAWDDYCPNGLQVEGRDRVRRLVSGVTACQALLDRAVALEADAVLVHHGYFWKGEDQRVSGTKRRRLATLLGADISLLAYHLPLDAHPLVGNNARLGELLGLRVEGGFGGRPGQEIGRYGSLPEPVSAARLAEQLRRCLERAPLHVAGREDPLQRVAWCTGAAQGLLEEAITLGVDAYVTGEISEQSVHLARESGVHFYAAGHHATERFGVQALGEHLADRFGIEHRYVEIDNPV